MNVTISSEQLDDVRRLIVAMDDAARVADEANDQATEQSSEHATIEAQLASIRTDSEDVLQILEELLSAD